MSGFFGRILNYIVGEVIVKTLAESRSFQRFAVRTDEALRTHKAKIQEAGDKIVNHAKVKGETLLKDKEVVNAPDFSRITGFFKHLGNEVKKDVAGSAKKR
jgi:hypothetical protein